MEKHFTSFIQQIHVITPFYSSVSTVTSRSYSIGDAVTDLIMLLPNQSCPVIDKLIVLPAPGVNTLEWFSNPTMWYDRSGLTSFHIVGNADHTNVSAFLKKVGPSVQDILSISMGDARPFDLSYTPKLLTLTLDIDMINMGQIHVSLLSLPKHSNLNNLTIVIRGPYFIPKILTTIWLLPDALKSRCNWM
ncbi:hypothetical protein ARMGADRAFT_1081145 [Armillaria gallica]|uniref:Uncharacterized protein n=1 Tax=Armillaria gallica TaxID=47427 RepID=A0A2H3DLJ5_ARMGA|nr:hypothetical protein ARMGADRAFT_1081145 [Armillaria gallica]